MPDEITHINYLFRKRRAGQHSIEGLFQSISARVAETQTFKVRLQVAPWISAGVWRRLLNYAWARSHPSKTSIQHITGDISYTAIFASSTRTILTVHDGVLLDQLKGIRLRIYRLLWVRLPCRYAAIVTVISEETKARLLRHANVPNEKVVVVPNAVAPIFQPSPKTFSSSRPTILQIGTAHNKNLDRVASALEGTPCILHIIGRISESSRSLLERMRLDIVNEYNLSQQQVFEAYCNSDMVIFASTSEGFGMPIVEAQMTGRPVVTSDCSCMPWVAGEGACLVDPFDVMSIRDGIRRVIADATYRQSLVNAGFQNVKRFDIDAITRQYLDIYRELANQA